MTHVIGIDPSSKKIAICTTIGIRGGQIETPNFRIIDLPEGVYPATGAAFREVFAFLDQEDVGEPVTIYMEAPVVGRNAYSTIVQAQVGGAIMAAAQNRGVELFLVNVNSWKKEVVGKGNASKDEVAVWLKENWPAAYNSASGDQDLIDASAINRYGHNHVRLAQAIVLRSKRGSRKG